MRKNVQKIPIDQNALVGLNLGDYVRLRRLELGLTQGELAERFDPPVTQSDVSAIERGRIKLPPPVRMKQLAAALETTPYDLLERSGWTGAAGAAALASLEEAPVESKANSRWRMELEETLPRLSGSDIRILLAMAKQLLRAKES